MATASSELVDVAKRARQAGNKLQALTSDAKNAALRKIKEVLAEREAAVMEANERDKAAAGGLGVSEALFKRLDLAGDKYKTLLAGLDGVAALEEPVGKVSLATRLDDGLDLFRVSCPIGVICVIFEARPEAAVQIAALCIKSANAVILKGGKEAVHSNAALIGPLREALEAAGLPKDAVQLVETREEVGALLSMDEYIDLVIPRGSNRLVSMIKSSTRIPVLGHADGMCSVYLDESADGDKAAKIVVDSKTNYPAACNSAETLLVHRAVLSSVLPSVGTALAAAGVAMRADAECLPLLPSDNTTPATDEDFRTEFLNHTIAVKAVGSVAEAVEWINSHGSHHTDAIVTEDAASAEYFQQRVDSAGVFHNASTRFADGFRYGFGAEVGVSTNRVHARGPVGLEGLLIYKYRLYGRGQVAGDYGVGPGKREYAHTALPLTLPARDAGAGAGAGGAASS